MGENLDEMDEFGNGIRVPASYYLQIYRAGADKSAQREVQAKTDTPAQMFYSFGELNQVSNETYVSGLAEALSWAGINGTVKMVTIPMAKNTILVRLENIADILDKEAVTRPVFLEHSLEAMYMAANKDATQAPEIKITEKSLTGNMDLVDEMLKRKIQWKTVDDDKPEYTKSKITYDTEDIDPVTGLKYITLEPQRIRTFLAVFTPPKEEFMQI